MMIKFFRQVRYKLLRGNKTGNYLKYALGEIILVVLGIMIALSINNWNERVKDNQKTIQSLRSLQSDLEIDMEEITRVIREQSFRSEAMYKAIELSKNASDSSMLKSDTAEVYNAGLNITFFPVTGSYKAASNAGLIDNIKNEELKQNILYLYEHLYVRVGYNAEINDERLNAFEWENSRLILNYTGGLIFDRKALQNKAFIDQLRYVNRFIGVYVDRCNATKIGIETTLRNIEKYINSDDPIL